MFNGKDVPKFEEVFDSKEPEYVDNAILKEMWLDYMQQFNSYRRAKNKGGGE